MEKIHKKKVIFIGGKQIGVECLKYLIGKNIIPELVFPNLDDHGKDTWHESLVKIAQKANIQIAQNARISSPKIIKKIKTINPEIIFAIGGTQLIPKEILTIPKLGCLNIHPALLPKYRGRYSTAHAIFNGEKHTGVTVHWMDERIDSGPTIMQKGISISDDDTAKTLYNKFTKTGLKLFIKFIQKWINGEKIIAKPQDESQATYYPKGLPNNGQIDWSWNGKKIRNFIRAMTFEPFPPAEFKIGNKKMVIIDEKYFKGFK